MTDLNIRVPVHKVDNSNEEIIITIVAPLSKPNEACFLLDKQVFTFISNPYFLKIKLPHPVFEVIDEQNFEPSTSTYSIKFKKQSDQFTDSSQNDFAEFVGLQSEPGDKTKSSSEDQEEFTQHYGFANKYCKAFGKLADTFSGVVNLPNPDTTPVELRRELREMEEKEKWNDDHYLADTMETEHLESIFKYTQTWKKSPVTELNDDMKELLKSCESSKNVDLSQECHILSELQIVDVLFCYAYDKRINEGDTSVESAWTINKLCSTLSWFEVFKDLRNVLVTCYKRSLIYPLYRNWNLAELVQQDVTDLLESGSIQVTQSLLEIKEMFDESENRYLLNTLYINHLCWYSYNMSNDRLLELSKDIKKIKVTKYEVNNELPLLEVAAHLTLQEETEGRENETGKIAKIVDLIQDVKLESSSSSDSSDDEEDDDDDDDHEESD